MNGMNLGRRLCAAAVFFVAFERNRCPYFSGLPYFQETDQASHRDYRCDHVDQLGADVVGDQELHDGKTGTGDQNGRPDLHHGATPGKRPDQPEGNQQRKERQLATDHGRHRHGVVTVHLGQGQNRCAQSAEGYRRGVGNQRQARGRQRRKTQSDQNCCSHSHRRTETGCAFKECAEGKRDQQQLQAAVFGDTGDRVLQNFEAAVLFSQLVQENDVEHNPTNGQQTGETAEYGCIRCHTDRHAVSENGNSQCGDQACGCGNVRFHVQKTQTHQHDNHRNGRQ